jgi:hypothetical protein
MNGNTYILEIAVLILLRSEEEGFIVVVKLEVIVDVLIS